MDNKKSKDKSKDTVARKSHRGAILIVIFVMVIFIPLWIWGTIRNEVSWWLSTPILLLSLLSVIVGARLGNKLAKKMNEGTRHVCNKCSRNLELGWTACPYCGEKVSLTK